MTGQERFDQQARARYRDAAAALSPALQGRLRAARRNALAGTTATGRNRARPPAMPIAAMVAAVVALAFGLRMQTPVRPGDRPVETRAISATQPAAPEPAPPAQAAPTQQASNHETLLPMLDEDPDFYLWLGSDDALPATLEPRHDPS